MKKILNVTKNTVISDNCRIADRFFTRLLGLIGEKNIKEGDGLLITPCNSIHMFFMRFPLDIIFIDTNGVIVHIEEGIKPWRISKIVPGACCVVELPSGTIARTCTQCGDRIFITE